MPRKALIASSLIGLLFGGCIIQMPPQQQQTQRAQQPQYIPEREAPVYEYEHRDWTGPGWYYGIYFRNEDRYRNWHKQRRSRRYYYRDRRAYPAPPRADRRDTLQQQSK